MLTINKIIIYIGLPLLVLCCGMIYRKYTWLPQDNPVEEIVEQVIKEYTGVNVDLSPDTKEIL